MREAFPRAANPKSLHSHYSPRPFCVGNRGGLKRVALKELEEAFYTHCWSSWCGLFADQGAVRDDDVQETISVDGCETVFLAFHRMGFDILSYPSSLGLVSQHSLTPLTLASKGELTAEKVKPQSLALERELSAST